MTLRKQRDADGSRHLGVEWRSDGGLSIRGQDLGRGVEGVFGAGLREYEWEWMIRQQDIPAAVAALGGRPSDDPIVLLKRWIRRNPLDPGIHLRDSGVPISLWSRLGD